MTTLSFNPAFHAALLSTLREGVIHLALPQPEIAGQPDFPARALQDLLGVTPGSWLGTRFQAATDLIQFATRNLPDDNRPQSLAPLWGTKTWKPDTALMNGVLRYLEGVTQEACLVLNENVFQLSLQVWNGPDNPTNWEVLADYLEQNEVGWVGRSTEGDVLSDVFRRIFPPAYKARIHKLSSIGYQTDHWKMGFLTSEVSVGHHHERVLRRLQLLPETRFLRALRFRTGKTRTMNLLSSYSSFFLKRITILKLNYLYDNRLTTWTAILPKSQVMELSLAHNAIDDAGIQVLAKALPESRVTGLDLRFNRLHDTGAQALAMVLPVSRVTELNLCNNGIGDAGAQALNAVLSNSRVKELDLSANPIGAATSQMLKETARQNGIRIVLEVSDPRYDRQIP